MIELMKRTKGGFYRIPFSASNDWKSFAVTLLEILCEVDFSLQHPRVERGISDLLNDIAGEYED